MSKEEGHSGGPGASIPEPRQSAQGNTHRPRTHDSGSSSVCKRGKLPWASSNRPRGRKLCPRAQRNPRLPEVRANELRYTELRGYISVVPSREKAKGSS